eukprot:CAMPEP_0184671378 /NCGR_PEP_ID=MMETSP0308-20130426/85458_1 /TAXON_ID=38269 /ORGANISM="Gloeochaete witrockiana, Strain SAG 46.84" /LENGTH=234 /DNA_ID=CAMNT_0027118483 /DNA_START=319 /DNA_END=1023 /DNA_ORIENTATION=-
MGRSPSPSRRTTLFVGNLSYYTRAKDLQHDFGRYGSVKYVDVPIRPGTNKPKGFAFVEFDRADDAELARRKLDHAMIDGREVRVEFAGAPPRRRRSPPPRDRRRSRSRSPRRDRDRDSRERSVEGPRGRSRDDSRKRSRSPDRDGKDSPVKKSPRVSPKREARSKSPVREARSKSPVREARSKSPVREARSKSPVREARSKSPVRESRRDSPLAESKDVDDAKSPVDAKEESSD